MKKVIVAAMAAMIAAVSGVLLVGCETQSANQALTVSPASAVVRQGESVTFTANGGFEYAWDTDTDAYGILTIPGRNQATYTCIAAPTEVAVVTLTVSSTITGQAQNTSTNTATGTGGLASTEVYITHQP